MARIDFEQPQLIVAMDHGRAFGTVQGLEDPGRVIEAVIEAGADGIMTSFGVIKRHADVLIGSIPTLMRLDGGPSLFREDWLENTEWSLLHAVNDARELEVDGVCVMLFMGAKVELKTMEVVAEVAGECLSDGLQVMVEALPCPCERIPDPKAAGPMAAACRIGFEHGADVLKTYYPGTVEGFRKVIDSCPAPVLIAGGPKMESMLDVLTVVRDSIEAGGRGVVFGRNIWQSPDPAAMVRALRDVMDGEAVPEEALRRLRNGG